MLSRKHIFLPYLTTFVLSSSSLDLLRNIFAAEKSRPRRSMMKSWKSPSQSTAQWWLSESLFLQRPCSERLSHRCRSFRTYLTQKSNRTKHLLASLTESLLRTEGCPIANQTPPVSLPTTVAVDNWPQLPTQTTGCSWKSNFMLTEILYYRPFAAALALVLAAESIYFLVSWLFLYAGLCLER